MGATALHYGQACFEGLKAFAHQDGSVHVFRPDENAKRLVFFPFFLTCYGLSNEYRKTDIFHFFSTF